METRNDTQLLSKEEQLQITKETILAQFNQPEQLEALYRKDESIFKMAFNQLYPIHKEQSIFKFWNGRLNFVDEAGPFISTKNLLIMISSILFAGLIAKIPFILNIPEDYFYQRNISFIVIPFLILFFALRNQLSNTKIIFIISAIILSVVYINSFPIITTSDTFVLSCIHLVIFMWSILGFAFVGNMKNGTSLRLAFLKYNGDLIVITTLILIAGGIMTGVCMGLFELIGMNIEQFYAQQVLVFALPAAPILGTYLTQKNPQLVGKISPVIAKIFSPLVLIMLITYLVAVVYSGKDPYNDREFLLIFNVLLIGVMAIIFFSIAESNKTEKSKMELGILLLLSIVTIIVNAIALSAIVFRISEWGITPNRLAVLGSNILVLINLLLVTAQLFRVIGKKATIEDVGKSIATYLPIYFIWSIVVCFLFPLIFGN